MGLVAKVKFFFLKRELKKKIEGLDISGDCVIEFPSRLESKGFLYIGPGAYWSLKGGLKLGRNVIFGPQTVVWTYNHNYKSGPELPYGGEDILKEINIGDNCWIGFGAIILPGAVIGEGCIIAAGSVVSGIFPNNSLIMGNPAKVIKVLDPDRYDRLKANSEFYLINKLKKI
jgi:acetyltransferase-like isoleucine patch superfamily enzyme